MKKHYLLIFLIWTTGFAQAQIIRSIQTSGAQLNATCYVNDSLMYFAYQSIGVRMFDGSTVSAAPFMPLHTTVMRSLAYYDNKLWVGTNEGLCETSGGLATVIRAAGGQIPGDTILSLAVLGNQLFVGTEAGLAIYNGSTWQTFTAANSLLPANRINNLKVNQNTLGIAAANFAVRYRNAQFEVLGGPYSEPVSLVMPYVANSALIGFTNRNSLFRSTNGTVYTLSGYDFVVDAAANSTGEVLYFLSRGRVVTMTDGDMWWSAFPAARVFLDQQDRVYLHQAQLNLYASFNINTGQQTSRNTAFLDINQVEAKYMAQGDMFWDRQSTNNPHYKVPKRADTTSSLFAHALWIGGLNDGIRYQSSQTYRQGAVNLNNFNSGLLLTNGALDTANAWAFDRMWKVNRFDVEAAKQAWGNGTIQNGSYLPSRDIRDWPGNRPGSTEVLAPFFDRNNDGVYNWQQGDYPLIKGDQALWWVYHDRDASRHHTDPAMGVEIRCMAYAYTCDQASGIDTVLNYTTFLDYTVKNYSPRTYDSAFLGLFVDGEIGHANDDFMGSDVQGNGVYFYNAQAIDPGPRGYGANPPAQGMYVLKGPLAPANDGIDNNRNGLIDEPGEDLAIHTIADVAAAIGSSTRMPTVGDDHYHRARGRWTDGLPIIFGGNGVPGSMGSMPNLPSRFIYQGNTDTIGWSIGGNTQNQLSLPFSWTETNNGGNPNLGNDRRAAAYLGTFSFAPQATVTTTVAFVYSRGTSGPLSSVTKLLTQDAPRIRQWYAAGNFPSCLDLSTVGARQLEQAADVQIYPNPAREQVTLAVGEGAPAHLVLMDAQGRVLLRETFEAGQKHALNIAQFAPGVYLLHITQAERVKQHKLVKQ
ncbi:MAG: T9SS type A sorting domain-containing protein [Sphingobacteriaceae bacterium]|nr:T9SS type A sorting domain-containing protein [Sphingobacteriaceae bacterium]